jgi:rod shape-determining protein MreD
MRWIPFILLLYLAAGLQAGALLGFPHANTPLPWPTLQYVMLLVVFYSLFANEQLAPLAALAAGLALDLINPLDVLGTSTMAMGLVSLAIIAVRMSIFREHAASQIIMTILAVLLFAVVAGTLRSVGPGVPDTQVVLPFAKYFGLMSANAVYTGLLAPLVFWLLLQMRNLLGFAAHGGRAR